MVWEVDSFFFFFMLRNVLVAIIYIINILLYKM